MIFVKTISIAVDQFYLIYIFNVDFLFITLSSFLSNYQIHKSCLILDNVFFVISFCFFNSLPNGEYLDLLIVAVYSNKSFSEETFLSVKNLYLPKFPDHKAKNLAVCLSKLYWALFFQVLLSRIFLFCCVFIFSLTVN